MKRLYGFLIFVVLVSACVGGKAPADRLVIAIDSSPATFDPRIATDSYGMKINRLIFNSLVKLDEHFDYVPDLAVKYEQVDDTTYKFYLRRGVFFHSGREVAIDDVIYTFKSIMDGRVASPFKTTFSYIKELVREPDDILVVRLKEPYAPFLTAMMMGIIPKDYVEKMGADFGLHPVGTGPYKFVEYKEDSHVLFQANQDYFGVKPRLPYLEFKVLKDDNVRVLQLMKGNVDLVQNAVPPVLLEMLGKKGELVVESGPSIVFDYMGMNLTDPLLSRLPVRKALAYAINREEIIKYKWEGYGEIADTLLSPTNWAYTDDVTKYNYDLNKAKDLLDEAGYPDPDGDGPLMRFYLSYKTSTIKQRIDIANLIAEQLKKVGIGITVTPYEWGTLFRDIKTGNFQLYSLSWVGVTEPDIYYTVLHSSEMPPAGANRDRFVNREVDRLVELGRTTTDKEKRRALYMDVQKIASDELPYIPLWYEDNVVVRHNYVDGYEMRPDTGFQGVANVTKKSLKDN